MIVLVRDYRQYLLYGKRCDNVRTLSLSTNMSSTTLRRCVLLIWMVQGLLLQTSTSMTTFALAAAASPPSPSNPINVPSYRPDGSSTLSSADDDKPIVISNGIKNLGNTCYMNAQLECAFHIPAVRQQVLTTTTTTTVERATTREDATLGDGQDENGNDDNNNDGEVKEETTSAQDVTTEEGMTEATEGVQPKEEEQEEVVVTESEALIALRGLFQEMIDAAKQQQTKSSSSSSPLLYSSPSGNIVAPRNFCYKLGINVMVQQDSQEFWKLLLPAINKESLSDLYKGTFEDYIVALDGSGREKRREELFLDLSMDIKPGSTLLKSIEASFGVPETLRVSEGNGWRPEKGADKVDAHKGSSLIAKGLPPILQFHLKRFNYDWQRDTTTKLNDQFAFPQTLDLSSVCSPQPSVNDKQSSDITNEKNNDDNTNNQKDGDDEELKKLTLYDLQSVVVHVGEYGAGHYYSYVRPNICSDTWYRFNDHVVEEVSFQQVVDDAFGGNIKSIPVQKHKPSSNKNSSGGDGRGFFGKVKYAIFAPLSGKGKNRRKKDGEYGWGGPTSNAYVVQYVRRADIPMLYEGKKE